MNLLKVITIILFISILQACSGSDDKLEKKLREAIVHQSALAIQQHLDYSEIRLSTLTSFDWDKFYIFEEYVTNENISDVTGISWDGDGVPSGKRRLLFICKNKIIEYVDFNPETFPVFFYPCGETTQFQFDKKDDLFAVFKKCDKNGCLYSMVPKRCIKAFINNIK